MEKKICWPVLLFLGGYHLFLAIALPIYFLNHIPSLALVLTTIGLVFASGMAIAAGYHRFYSHRCYKVHPVIEAILLFFGTLATQGSAIRWANDHRLHHAFVDTDKDPYSIKKGLLHAHILWMFFKTDPIDPKVVSDLTQKKLLVFQNKYYPWCMLGVNLLVFLVVGCLLGDFLGAFIFAWWVRMLFLHHTTYCINSLAHFWGTQDYSREHSAVDNYLISLLTYGEGYHNYHHSFASDYRNGIHWYHFDPAKWFIWTLYKLGLAYDLRRVDNYRIAHHLLLQHKNELIQKLKDSHTVQRVNEVAQNICTKLEQMKHFLDSDKLHELKKDLKKDWQEWKMILKMIQKTAKTNN